MPVQHHRVAIVDADGNIAYYPMKQWLREHPEENPTGQDPSMLTSHQLRGALQKTGWSINRTDSEVLLTKPSSAQQSAALERVLAEPEEDADNSEITEAAFALEYQLRDFIAANLSVIDVGGRHLRLYLDDVGRNGVEYPSAVGPIDILAVDETGHFYVFELKRARSPDHAIGQLTRYMGWIHQTIGNQTGVSGFIVAKEITNNLRYAVSVVPNVSLFEYEVEFRLKSANTFPTAPNPSTSTPDP